MPFPSPPWKLQGTLWLSLFAVRSQTTAERPPGLYVATFVDYTEPGVLVYRELLVARLVRAHGVPRVHITDIWVDSEESRDGGRSLWAIPKDLAAFELSDRRLGATARTAWSGRVEGRPVADARFTGASGVGVRAPLVFSTAQQREDGTPVVAKVSGSAKGLPCLGGWTFDSEGPLSWLSGHPAFASFRLSDFRLAFGG